MSEAPPDEMPGCTIRTLPPELLMESARVAVDIYPGNRPAVAQFATLVEGDASDVMTPQFIAALTTKYLGPKPRKVPVRFEDAPDAETIRLVLGHANAWDCGIEFVHTTGEGVVRVTRGFGGFWSYLGTDVWLVRGPTMNLQGFTSRTPISEYRRVVTHEFGHTLGFPHEHMRRDLVARLDRERTVAYFAQTQGWSRRDVELQVLTPLDEASVMGTPADSTSIMCYQLPGSITVDGLPIPGGDDVNAADLAFADTIYPKADSPPPPTPPPPVEPPRPKPPEPAEEFGPYDLRPGVESDGFTMLPGASVLFRFRTRRKGAYVASTRGKTPLRMDLLGANGAVIDFDDDASGFGPNALIAMALARGTYYLRVRGMTAEDRGPFRAKVMSIPS